MKNKFLFCILILLFNNSYANIQMENFDKNIIIVRDKDEIEKYKKFFVKFMPNKFELNEKNEIVLANEYKNKNSLSSFNDSILVSFIKSGNTKNGDFRLIFVWSYKLKSGSYSYKIYYNYEIFYQGYEYENYYYIETYFPPDDIYCFFGIINNNNCMSKLDFIGKTKINKKEFYKIIKENDI